MSISHLGLHDSENVQSIYHILSHPNIQQPSHLYQIPIRIKAILKMPALKLSVRISSNSLTSCLIHFHQAIFASLTRESMSWWDSRWCFLLFSFTRNACHVDIEKHF